MSYIIVQRPLSRLLDFWNCMLDRHQAEITVMQFTGHSLPVHQSMSVPWEFFTSSHFISQFPPTRFPLITAIRMCHFLPVHHSERHFWPGRRSKYHNGSNCNECVLQIPKSSRTRISPSNAVLCHIQNTAFWGGALSHLSVYCRYILNPT